jgi:hypothetical protein
MIIGCGLSLANVGCLSGSLAVSTINAETPQWSTADKQVFAPGEPLQAQLIIRKAGQENPVDALGLADYCVFEVNSIRYFANINEAGVFQSTFDLPRAPNGTKLDIKATAYAARGRADFMDLGGEWVAAESPHNPTDQRIVGDRIQIIVQRRGSDGRPGSEKTDGDEEVATESIADAP